MSNLVKRPTPWRTPSPLAVEDNFDQSQLLRYGDVINRFARHKIERRIGLVLFGRWFGIESSKSEIQIETIQLTAGRTLAAASRAPLRRRGATLAAALCAVLITTVVVVGFKRWPFIPAVRRDVLVVSLKPPSPVTRAAPSENQRGRPLAVAIHPKPISTLAVADRPLMTPVDRLAESKSEVITGADSPQQPTLAQARAQALSSNEPSYWTEGQRSGVVVVGQERSQDGKLCRQVVVFARINGDRGSSESSQACRVEPSVRR